MEHSIKWNQIMSALVDLIKQSFLCGFFFIYVTQSPSYYFFVQPIQFGVQTKRQRVEEMRRKHSETNNSMGKYGTLLKAMEYFLFLFPHWSNVLVEYSGCVRCSKSLNFVVIVALLLVVLWLYRWVAVSLRWFEISL